MVRQEGLYFRIWRFAYFAYSVAYTVTDLYVTLG